MSTPKRYPKSDFLPLTDDSLRQVWQWRNLEDVRSNMHNSDFIPWEAHTSWYETLKSDPHRRFFVMHQDSRPIGVLNFHAMDEKTLEWGCYLGEKTVWPGSGLLLEIAALDYATDIAKVDSLYAEVLSFNTSVIKMHQLFAYSALHDKTSSKAAHHIKRFIYKTSDWQSKRAEVLMKLPKQIRAAADQIHFT